MRKLNVLVLLCMVAVTGFAQVENAGKFGTELYLNLWNNKSNTLSLIEGAKFRYFTSNKFAIRGTVNLLNTNNKAFFYDEVGDTYWNNNETEYKVNANYLSVGFMPGVEFHVANYKRTSVYVGAEAGFEIQRTSLKAEDEEEKIVAKGLDGSNRNSFKVGAFTGIDVYLLKNLYLGAELGLQYKAGKSLKETQTITYPDGDQTKEVDKDYSKFSHIGFYCLPSLRIGWNF